MTRQKTSRFSDVCKYLSEVFQDLRSQVATYFLQSPVRGLYAIFIALVCVSLVAVAVEDRARMARGLESVVVPARPWYRPALPTAVQRWVERWLTPLTKGLCELLVISRPLWLVPHLGQNYTKNSKLTLTSLAEAVQPSRSHTTLAHTLHDLKDHLMTAATVTGDGGLSTHYVEQATVATPLIGYIAHIGGIRSMLLPLALFMVPKLVEKLASYWEGLCLDTSLAKRVNHWIEPVNPRFNPIYPWGRTIPTAYEYMVQTGREANLTSYPQGVVKSTLLLGVDLTVVTASFTGICMVLLYPFALPATYYPGWATSEGTRSTQKVLQYFTTPSGAPLAQVGLVDRLQNYLIDITSDTENADLLHLPVPLPQAHAALSPGYEGYYAQYLHQLTPATGSLFSIPSMEWRALVTAMGLLFLALAITNTPSFISGFLEHLHMRGYCGEKTHTVFPAPLGIYGAEDTCRKARYEGVIFYILKMVLSTMMYSAVASYWGEPLFWGRPAVLRGAETWTGEVAMSALMPYVPVEWYISRWSWQIPGLGTLKALGTALIPEVGSPVTWTVSGAIHLLLKLVNTFWLGVVWLALIPIAGLWTVIRPMVRTWYPRAA